MKKLSDYFEHRCELDPEADIIDKQIPGDTKRKRWKRAFRRHFTISFTNIRARHMFRSTYAIDVERTRHVELYRYIIHPFSDFRRNWECFMILVYLYAFIMIPAYIGFINTNLRRQEQKPFAFFDFIQCLLCFFDIVVNFFSGYVSNSKKEVILSPGRIIVHYSFTFFIFDLISSVPLDYIANTLGLPCRYCQNYIELLRLTKFVRLWTMEKYIYRTADEFNFELIVTEVFWVFLRFLLIAHLFAALHYFLAWLLSSSNDDTWIQLEDIHDYLYMNSFFRASSNLFAVGFGMTQPVNYVDKLLTIIAVLCGCFMCIITVGKILQWAYIINASACKYEQMMQHLRDYMRNKQLPQYLRKRLVNFYNYRFQKTFFKESEIINSLSTQLRQEVVLQTCRRLVENVSFFNNLPMALLLRIVICLRSEMFLANDVIVKAGSTGDCMYFITCGTVAIYTATGKEVCHLEDGAHFGEIALVMPMHSRVASVVAVESCEIYSLDRKAFVRAVAPYPDLVMRIERVAEERRQRTVGVDERNIRGQRRMRNLKPETQNQEDVD